jgi:hypothetical protein
MTMNCTILETSGMAVIDVPSASPIPEGRALGVTIVDLDGGVLVRIEGEAGVAGLPEYRWPPLNPVKCGASILPAFSSHCDSVWIPDG